MKSSHWTNQPLPILKAVERATGAVLDSHNQIYAHLREKGIAFNSVVDFGCGTGLWLQAAIKLGVEDIRGYDIPEIPVENRKFPKEKFIPADLSKLLDFDRKFDLVVSAEVAEHIPINGIRNFIANLCGFGDVILFTAAPPYQGGMGHCNENWMEYWVALFREQGYQPYDFLRMSIWNDPSIAYYYRQNIMVFASEAVQGCMNERGLATTPTPPSLIHPELYLKAVNRSLPSTQSRLNEDIEIYYSHVQTLSKGERPREFDYGYGQEKLDFKSISKNMIADAKAKPAPKGLLRKLFST